MSGLSRVGSHELSHLITKGQLHSTWFRCPTIYYLSNHLVQTSQTDSVCFPLLVFFSHQTCLHFPVLWCPLVWFLTLLSQILVGGASMKIGKYALVPPTNHLKTFSHPCCPNKQLVLQGRRVPPVILVYPMRLEKHSWNNICHYFQPLSQWLSIVKCALHH